MTRLPIARSLPLALLGLTVALALVAALSVASLYGSRQDYEDELARAYTVETGAADVVASGIVREAVLRSPRPTPAERTAAVAGYRSATSRLARLARSDRASAALAAEIAGARRLGAVRAAARRIAARQRARRAEARTEARDASRRAMVTAAAAGGLALIAAFAFASLLIAGLRRPLEALLTATSRLAAGDLDARVEPAGPRELRDLAGSFNAMAADLETAQNALDAERRRLAAVIESLGDGLVVCDAHGRVVERNPRAASLIPELEPGHRLAREPSPLPDLADALGREAEVEHQGRTLSVTAARLGPRQDDGVVFTLRDVSERARLERLKTEFVATASHELRSPLTSIKGFVELLEASPALSDKQREFVEIVLLSTNRLVDLVNDLLDVARIEAGRMTIARRPVAVREVVEEVAALMRPRFEEAEQVLEVDHPPDVVAADADPERLRQIVTNLMTNAHLYTPRGGRVRVGIAPEDDGRVVLTVADTGQGMTREQLDHLFDRFYRAYPASSGAPPGSGLGLSIVRSLVDLHGGAIDVDSTPGEGTTFTVHLPRAQPTTEEESPRALLRGRRVMVVEDDPGIARLIATQLEPWDVETVLVSSGEEAIARLKAEPFDAVTLDILLGGMTGFEVLRAVREDPDLRDTAVVVVSVFSGREALAGEWVVSKPIDADELTGALGSAMLAGRTRVLVVGRDEVRPSIAGALERLEIDHEWASSGEAAARLCAARRFEVALVDAGLPSPHEVISRLDLRGRRERRSVIVFSDGADAPGLARLDAEPVAVETAGAAVLAALGESATAR